MIHCHVAEEALLRIIKAHLLDPCPLYGARLVERLRERYAVLAAERCRARAGIDCERQEIEHKLRRLADALETDGEALPAKLIERIRRHEARLKEPEAERVAVEALELPKEPSPDGIERALHQHRRIMRDAPREQAWAHLHDQSDSATYCRTGA
jgi:hypothetical protein